MNCAQNFSFGISVWFRFIFFSSAFLKGRETIDVPNKRVLCCACDTVAPAAVQERFWWEHFRTCEDNCSRISSLVCTRVCCVPSCCGCWCCVAHRLALRRNDVSGKCTSALRGCVCGFFCTSDMNCFFSAALLSPSCSVVLCPIASFAPRVCVCVRVHL